MMVLDSKNITVLMVDDDEINRQMAEMILTKKLPYKIITAESGMRCIELMHQYNVNLVLLDVDMPVWDGFKTLSAIRADKKLKDTPVIMLTAAADLGSVVKANEYGIQDYIKKPFLPDELADRVAKVIWDYWQQKGGGGKPSFNSESRAIYEEF
jgi:putative two-component system response regulator